MITATMPDVDRFGRYSVTETCAALGIHRNTLRKYTEAGMIRTGLRRESCRKFYTGAEIIRFWKAEA